MVLRVRVVWWMTGSLNHICVGGIAGYTYASRAIERCSRGAGQPDCADACRHGDWALVTQSWLCHGRGSQRVCLEDAMAASGRFLATTSIESGYVFWRPRQSCPFSETHHRDRTLSQTATAKLPNSISMPATLPNTRESAASALAAGRLGVAGVPATQNLSPPSPDYTLITQHASAPPGARGLASWAC